MEITAMDVAMLQLEATNSLEILMCGDKAILAEHFALAKESNGVIDTLADRLKDHYEAALSNQFSGDNLNWSFDLAHSLALDGLSLVDWKVFAKRILFLQSMTPACEAGET